MPPQQTGPDLGLTSSQTSVPAGQLEELLKENLAVAKDNNRLLRLIRRDALLGAIGKVVLWLVVLGVPIFFLSSYIAPLMQAVSGASQSTSTGPLGVPSKDQIDRLIQEYKDVYQP
jgi:hypothetical protein